MPLRSCYAVSGRAVGGHGPLTGVDGYKNGDGPLADEGGYKGGDNIKAVAIKAGTDPWRMRAAIKAGSKESDQQNLP
eukprot:175213-Rhodomonas_salina.1